LITKLDWNVIDSAVTSYRQKYSLDSESQAFQYLILEKFFPYYDENIKDLITDGGSDCGIDAIKIDRDVKPNHVHLFQFKCYEKHSKTVSSFSKKEIDKITFFLDRLFDHDPSLKGITNPYLWQKICEIWEIFQNPNTKFTVYLCSNGRELQTNERAVFLNALGQYRVNLQEISTNSVLKLIVSPPEEPTKHTFRAIEKQYLERMDGNIRGLIATISAKDLVEIVKDRDDPDKINPRIFDKNIRVFLGKDNTVNESIMKTAMSEKSPYFWYMNNGLTAVCSRFSYRPNTRSPIVEVDNIQIVNGAQTSCAVFEAAKSKKAVLDDVLLLIRIYETQDQDLPYDIAVATNSQTRIYSRDLMANSDIQKKIESVFLSHGFFYERKKGQYQDKDPELRIDALKLGQVVLAYLCKDPEKSKTDSDKIFGARYEEIFKTDCDASQFLNIYKMYQKLEKLRIEANISKRKGALNQVDEFLTYGLFHTIYVVSLLAEKNQINISTKINQDRLIKDSLSIMRRYLLNRKSYSFYNLFRSPNTKLELYDLAMDKGQLQLELISEETREYTTT
jgi:hypothetical protein